MNIPISIDRARDWALRSPHAVFYGVLASNLADVMDDTIATACTDGKVIRWSPEFVASLTEEEIRFVLLHETLHCAQGHFWRLPANKDGNIAGDYAINATLSKVAGIKAPAGALLDAKFADMAEEEILASLAKPEPEDEHGQPNDDKGQGEGEGQGEGQGEPQQGQGEPDAGGCGGFCEAAPEAPEAKQTLAEKWQGAIMQADFVAKSTGAGSAPADMQRLIDAARVTSPDWKQEMADFVKSVISQRNDWSRSARRMATAPCIYPRRRADQIGQIVCVRDTSLSTTGAVLNAFNALIESAMADTNCGVIILDCDYDVGAEYRLAAGDAVPATAKGGGGTRFQPAFDRIAAIIAEGEAIAGVVYLTDLEGPQADACDLPVLWLCTTDLVADFGRTVKVKL